MYRSFSNLGHMFNMFVKQKYIKFKNFQLPGLKLLVENRVCLASSEVAMVTNFFMSKPPKFVLWGLYKPVVKVLPQLYWCSCDWMLKIEMFKLLGASLICNVMLVMFCCRKGVSSRMHPCKNHAVFWFYQNLKLGFFRAAFSHLCR